MLHTDTRIYRHRPELARRAARVVAARGSANEVVAILDVALA